MVLVKDGREQGNVDSQPIFGKHSRGPFCLSGDDTGEENQLFLGLASSHGALLCLTVLLSGFLKDFLNFFSKQPLLGCRYICMLEGAWLSMLAFRVPSSQPVPIEAEMKQPP